MTRHTELLLRVALVCAILFFGWEIASQTVVALLTQNAQIQSLQRQLQEKK